MEVILLGCVGSSVSGKYYYEKDTKSYVELFDDGTFTYTFYDSGKNLSLSGTYSVNKDEITLKYQLFGEVKTLRKENGYLVDSNGGKWIKMKG